MEIQMKNVTEMSTKEIVEEFNRLTDKETKRFATRPAAEKALEKAREQFGPSLVKRTLSLTRSNSTSETWNDAAIAEKRSARHQVRVTSDLIIDGKVTKFDKTFDSVAKAFKDLLLPMSKHIKVRMEMVADGSVNFAGFTFTKI
jgi:hypothetical protein